MIDLRTYILVFVWYIDLFRICIHYKQQQHTVHILRVGTPYWLSFSKIEISKCYYLLRYLHILILYVTILKKTKVLITDANFYLSIFKNIKVQHCNELKQYFLINCRKRYLLRKIFCIIHFTSHFSPKCFLTSFKS